MYEVSKSTVIYVINMHLSSPLRGLHHVLISKDRHSIYMVLHERSIGLFTTLGNEVLNHGMGGVPGF